MPSAIDPNEVAIRLRISRGERFRRSDVCPSCKRGSLMIHCSKIRKHEHCPCVLGSEIDACTNTYLACLTCEWRL